MPDVWNTITERLGTGEGKIGAGATIGLALLVWRLGKSWLPALALTAVLIALEARAGTAPVTLVLHGIVFLILSGAVFWAIRRAGSLLLSLVLGLAAAVIFLSLK